MTTPDADAVRDALAAPFAPQFVKFKPGAVSGGRALAMPFIDARAVMDRLDDVFGVGGWQTAYREAKDGVVCTLRVLVGGQWAVHEDIGAESEQPDDGDRQKAAFSDALKRAAVHLGVGRYLYRLPPLWVGYDPAKRRFTERPALPDEAQGPPEAQPAPKEAPPHQPAMATVQQRANIVALKEQLKMADEAFLNLMKVELGAAKTKELTHQQAEQFLQMLRGQLPKEQRCLDSGAASTAPYGADAGRR